MSHTRPMARKASAARTADTGPREAPCAQQETNTHRAGGRHTRRGWKHAQILEHAGWDAQLTNRLLHRHRELVQLIMHQREVRTVAAPPDGIHQDTHDRDHAATRGGGPQLKAQVRKEYRQKLLAKHVALLVGWRGWGSGGWSKGGTRGDTGWVIVGGGVPLTPTNDAACMPLARGPTLNVGAYSVCQNGPLLGVRKLVAHHGGSHIADGLHAKTTTTKPTRLHTGSHVPLQGC
jgi:hypothetical protein